MVYILQKDKKKKKPAKTRHMLGAEKRLERLAPRLKAAAKTAPSARTGILWERPAVYVQRPVSWVRYRERDGQTEKETDKEHTESKEK